MKILLATIVAATVLSMNLYAEEKAIPQLKDEKMDAQTKDTLVNQFILDSVKAARLTKRQPQPPMVAEFNKKYTEYCLKRAEAEYKTHGRWFYCEDKKEFRGNIRWDEVITFRVYWQLVARHGSLEKIPNYTKENHQKAIEFWQGWEKEDGSFQNIFTGKGGKNQQQCNGKYIPGILDLLQRRPSDNEARGHGADKPDTSQFLKQIADRNLNHGTATAFALMERIQKGETGYIPLFEQSMEVAVAQLSVHTGMFHGRNGNPQGKAWSNYGTTDQTMKGMLRLIAYFGMENVPFRHLRADTIIKNHEWFRKGAVNVKRNTAEMMVHCLLESDYRADELLTALDGNSRVLLEGTPWKSHMTGDYAAYALMMFGAYLHWEGYEESTPRSPFKQGVQYDYRLEAGPFGRCVNLIKKTPEELITHKDWSLEKFGLRARNAAHEKRKVVDVVPASSEGWTQGTDKAGLLTLTQSFTLDKPDVQNPYIKIKWSGAVIEILLNGVLVKKKLGSLVDFGAVHIPEEARKALKKGKNTLVIRTSSQANELEVSAGLIDWIVPEDRK
jgi:hypothetical protein